MSVDGIIEEKIEVENRPIGLSDVNASTRLLDKNFSPLVVRKYQMEGWPMFIGLICDESLSDLDQTVLQDFAANYGDKVDDIQWLRNFCGALSDHLVTHYNNKKMGCVEGVAVIWYTDKCFISSLWGDFMTHASCKQELFFIINTLPHI